MSKSLNNKVKLNHLEASLTDFGNAGTGDAAVDTAAFLAMAAALTAGTVNHVNIPAGIYYLNQQIDINAPAGKVVLSGSGRYSTHIVTQVNAGTVTQKQYPFVIRNTTHGVEISGIAFEADPDNVSYYQNPLTFCNVSNLILQDFVSDNSDQFGVGIFDDVVAAVGQRTATACDNIVIRNGIIRNASQYGIQHFPKVPSSILVVEDLVFINCGIDVQNTNDFESASMKCGQMSRRTYFHNIDMYVPPRAVGMSIGNYEELKTRAIRIHNPVKQAVTVSAGIHPNLTSRPPITAGGANQDPYLPSHAMLDLEFDVTHDVGIAGKRTNPIITIQMGGNSVLDCLVTADTNVILSGLQTIAGVVCGAGSVVFLPNQTNKAENGAWVVGAGAWTRASALDSSSELVSGAIVNVTSGADRRGWILISAGPHTPGVTPQFWAPFTPGGPRIKATVNGEVVETGAYGGFVGSFHYVAGTPVFGSELDLTWIAGDTRGVSGSPAFPLAVVYMGDEAGKSFVNPSVRVNVQNKYMIPQQVFAAVWLKGQHSGQVSIKCRGMGNYAFRGESNVGAVVISNPDIQDFNLTNDAAQAPFLIIGPTGEYHIQSPVYYETAGVGNGDYWILGAGTAPVYINGQRSNVSLLVSANPMIVHQLDGRSGTAVLSAGTSAVSFTLQEPDTNYRISLGGSANETFRYLSKATTGFTITSSNAGSTASVDWVVHRV